MHKYVISYRKVFYSLRQEDLILRKNLLFGFQNNTKSSGSLQFQVTTKQAKNAREDGRILLEEFSVTQTSPRNKKINCEK